jgi:hypothetical protein
MFIGVLIIGIALIFCLFYKQLNLFETYFLFIVIVIGSLCILFGMFNIRCPYCGVHLPQYYMGKENYNQWLNTLLNCSQCPICKND